jgi:hypothetical protein
VTSRKGERTAHMNERDFPHIVEIAQPDGGFGTLLHAKDAWHRERGIETRRGRRQRRDDQEYVRWCFAEPPHAEAFRERFGGGRVEIAPRRR